MLQIFEILNDKIQKLFAENNESLLAHKKNLLEKTIQIRAKKIARIEKISNCTIAIHFFIGDKMGCKEFEASPSKIAQIITAAQEVNPEIRLRYL